MSELDRSVLEGLREFQIPGEPDLLGQVIDAFIEESRAAGERLTAALVEDDRKAVKFNAHALKGSSATIGATKSREIAAYLETNAFDLSRDEVMTQVGELNAAIERVSAELQELRGDSPS
jgi:HPt (histidine-containing phosphotransfer) domain-containing protein